MIIDEEAYLEHWGVKGMRWGVRNARRSNDTSTSTSTEKESEDEDDEFSDEELDAHIRRERAKKAALLIGGLVAGGLAANFLSKNLGSRQQLNVGKAFVTAQTVANAAAPAAEVFKKSYSIPMQFPTPPARVRR